MAACLDSSDLGDLQEGCQGIDNLVESDRDDQAGVAAR
jgi:hypothetical protein